MRVYTGLGTSDHWPIAMDLAKTTGAKEAELNHAIRTLQQKGVYRESFRAWQGTDAKTKQVFAINKPGNPVFTLKVGGEGKPVNCFIDTGSPVSIYNPDIGRAPNDDPELGDFFNCPPLTSQGCVLQGVGGARVEVNKTYKVPFMMDGKLIYTHMLCLDRHEETLPKILLGQRTTMNDFGGICMLPTQAGNLKICFRKGGAAWFYGEGILGWSDPIADVFANKLIGTENEHEKANKVFRLAARSYENQSAAEGGDSESTLEDALCAQAMQDCFVANSCPVVAVSVLTKEKSHECSVVIDQHSPHNFVSRSFLTAMGGDAPRPTKLKGVKEIVDMRGEIVAIKECVNLRLQAHAPLEVTAYVIPEMGADLVIGTITQAKVNAKVGANGATAEIRTEASVFALQVRERIEWRTAVPLKIAKATVLPPRTQSRVQLRKTSRDDVATFEQGVKLIAPVSQTFGSRIYKVAWGPCENPEWVQIANPANEPITLAGGEFVAELHLGGEWKTESVDLDPTPAENAKERQEHQENKQNQLVRALHVFGVGQGKKAPVSPFEILKNSPTGSLASWSESTTASSR
jgi:hypothetical protein